MSDGVLTQMRARELAGEPFPHLWQGESLRYKPFAGHLPPWGGGAEGIAYPLVNSANQVRAYFKTAVCRRPEARAKRRARLEWIIRQKLHHRDECLVSAPQVWVETPDCGGYVAAAANGRSWAAIRESIALGARLSDGARMRMALELVRLTGILEALKLRAGDLSANNVLIDQSSRGKWLRRIDFDSDVLLAAPAALRTLKRAEGGTIGTPGYVDPLLYSRAAQGDPNTAPMTHVYARNMLLVEFLGFDRGLPDEDSPAMWDDSEQLRILANVRLRLERQGGAVASTLYYLTLPAVLAEARRPTSLYLMSKLGLTLPAGLRGAVPSRMAPVKRNGVSNTSRSMSTRRRTWVHKVCSGVVEAISRLVPPRSRCAVPVP